MDANAQQADSAPADSHRALLYLHPDAFAYEFGPDHPWKAVRLRALMALIDVLAGPDGETRRITPRVASREELGLAHSTSYINAVERLSSTAGAAGAAGARLAESVGLGPGDTPAFEGMHEIAAAIAGATLAAVREVLSGGAAHALSPSGGLHHAMRERASGFCVYNDLVVAIAHGLREYGCRVLYVDFDAHHGDGVQAAFYEDPRVLTVSFHESGRYLFPGTGSVDENGAGAGTGYCLNVPMSPFTQDDSWLGAIEAVLPRACEWFRPDLIVSQHGCDSHIWDPITHLGLTMDAFRRQTELVHRLAHEFCNGRWVAAGGGGYQPLRVVPRAWAAVWLEMTGVDPPARLPAAWLDAWSPLTAEPIPDGFADPIDAHPNIPRRTEIEAENRTTLDRLQRLIADERR